MGRIFEAKNKQVLLYQGEASNFVYLIKSGFIKSYTTLPNGNEVIISIHGPLDHFPTIIDASKVPFSLFYYETMTECSLESFSQEEFADYSNEHGTDQYESSKRYLTSVLHINALVQISANERLSHTMQYLAIRFGTLLSGKLYTRIDMKLTQQDIANLCNLSRETTNLELSVLKSKNIITEKNKFYLINMNSLNSHIGHSATSEIEL